MFIKLLSLPIFILIWIGLAGADVPIFMIAAPLFVMLIALKMKVLPKKIAFRIGAIPYFMWLLKEVIMSSIAVSKIAWRKNLKIQPMVEPVKSVQRTDVGIVTYANSVTLTPGTVTLSIDSHALLVHAIDIRFMDDLQEGEMDRRIKKIIC
ncbi:MAG: cation transporter [Rickettsiales bacterium]|nr:MAG: cation transporter [Rickettsiales bacterium]